MRILVVDDEQVRHDFFDQAYAGHEVVHAYRYYEATDALAGEKFDIVQLDHDLGDHVEPDHMVEMYGRYELNGYHVAVYLVMDLPYDKRPDKVIIQSTNYNGARSIELWLERHDFDVVRQPFIYQTVPEEPDYNIGGRVKGVVLKLNCLKNLRVYTKIHQSESLDLSAVARVGY